MRVARGDGADGANEAQTNARVNGNPESTAPTLPDTMKGPGFAIADVGPAELELPSPAETVAGLLRLSVCVCGEKEGTVSVSAVPTCV